MAIEESLLSLTDKIDNLVSKMTPGKQNQDLASSFEEAIQNNFGSISQAISDIDGGGVEKSINAEDVSSQVVTAVSDQTANTIDTFADTISAQIEGKSGEEVKQEATQTAVQGEVESVLSDQINQDFEKVNQLLTGLSESANVSAEQVSVLSDIFGTFRERINSVAEDVEAGERSIGDAQDQIEGAIQDVSNQFEEAVGSEFSDLNSVVSDLTDFSDEFFTNVQETTEQFAELNEGFSTVDFVEIGGALSEIGGGAATLSDTIETKFQQLTNVFTEQNKTLKEAVTELRKMRQRRKTIAEQAPQSSPEQDLAQQQIAEQLSPESIESVEQISGSASALSADAGSLEDIDLKEQGSVTQKLNDTFKALSQQISKTRILLTGLAAPIIFATDLLVDAFGAARDFREETGIGTERMRELREVTADVSTELARFGLSPGATTDIALSLREQFGSIKSATAVTGENLDTLVTKSGALASGLGVSSERAAEVFGTVVDLEAALGGSADQALRTTVQLARQEEVAPQAVLEDIAKNSEDLAKFAGTSVENLANAAVEAQKLGVSLGKITDIQESFLTDVSGTVQEFQRFEQLSGQAIDTTGLLRASFQGTEALATKLRQELGNINLEQFANNNPLAAMQLEDAVGISFQEIARIGETQRNVEGLNTELQKAQAISEGDVSFAEAVGAGEVDQVQKLKRQFNSLYFLLAEELFPVISSLADALIPALSATLKILRPILEGFAEGLEFILSPLEVAAEYMGSFTKKIKNVKKVGDELSPTTQALIDFAEASESVLKAFGSFLAVDAVIGQLGKLVGVSNKLLPIFSKLKGLIPGLAGGMGGKLLPSALDLKKGLVLLRSKFTGIIGGISRFIGKIPGLKAAFTALRTAAVGTIRTISAALVSSGWGAAIVAIGAAIGVAIYAFEDWNEAVQVTSDFIGSFIDELFGLEGTAKIVASSLRSVGSFVSEMYNEISSGISSFYEGKNAAEALGSSLGYLTNYIIDVIFPFENFIGVIEGVVTSLYELITLDFDSFLDELGNIGYNLVDAFLPDELTAYLGTKMNELMQTVADYFFQSPPERGPLIDIIGSGETMIDMVFGIPGYAASVTGNLVSSITDTFISGIKSAVSSIRSFISESADFAGMLVDKFQTTEGSITDKLKVVGRTVVEKILPKGADVDAAMEELENAFSAVFDVADAFSPLDEAFSYVKRLTVGISDLGYAISEGNFSQLDDIIINMAGDLGYNLIDMIFPDAITEYVAGKVQSIAQTIRDFFPFSPPERGPLVDLGTVGYELSNLVFEGAFDTIPGMIDNVLETIEEGFTSIPGIIADAVSGIPDIVGDAISGVEDMFSIENFQLDAESITPDLGNVSNLMSQISETIDSFIPSSPAEQGALSDIDERNVISEAIPTSEEVSNEVSPALETVSQEVKDVKVDSPEAQQVPTAELEGSEVTITDQEIQNLGDQVRSSIETSISDVTVADEAQQVSTAELEQININEKVQNLEDQVRSSVENFETSIPNVTVAGEAQQVPTAELTEVGQTNINEEVQNLENKVSSSIERFEAGSIESTQRSMDQLIRNIDQRISTVEEASSIPASNEENLQQVDRSVSSNVEMLNLAQISTRELSEISESIDMMVDAIYGLVNELETQEASEDGGIFELIFGDETEAEEISVEEPALPARSVVSSGEDTTRSIQPEIAQADDTATTITAQSVGFDSIRTVAEGTEQEQAGTDIPQIESTPVQNENNVEVNPNPVQTEVATVDETLATPQQQSTEEIQIDSSEDNVEQILSDILAAQQQLHEDLMNGNIAVYLDGRRINKELVRETGI